MEFFDYSFSEMGMYDQPAFYQLILSHYTNRDQKIIYIGHSQGTSQMFAGQTDPISRDYLSYHTEKFIAIAPIVFMTKTSYGLLEYVAKLAKVAQHAVNDLGIYELMTGGCSKGSSWDDIAQWSCDNLKFLCDPQEDIFGGFDTSVDNIDNILSTYLAHNPSGTSVKTYAHYGQLISPGPYGKPIFNKFDYVNKTENQAHYSQDTPPDYDLSLINVEMHLIRESKDIGATEENVNIQLSKLQKNIWKLYLIPNWLHATVMYSIDPKPIFDIFDQLI